MRWDDAILDFDRDGMRRGAPRRSADDTPRPVPDDWRFKALKRFIARQYHPNRPGGGAGAEGALRTALFRELWAEVERLERLDRS